MLLFSPIALFLASALASPPSYPIPKPNTGGSGYLKVAAFPYWINDGSIPINASFEKYTAVSYAFGLTSPNVSIVELPDTGVSLPDFVVHQKNTSAILSVGGWYGSMYFSSAVATAENRTIFVLTIIDHVQTYDLDGIDFVWNPNNQGIGNLFSPNDTANFLLFLQELRKEAGEDLYLSATAQMTPFLDENGAPTTDVSPCAFSITSIVLNAYDVWGNWDNNTLAGPNAPLNDTCAAEGSQKGSVVSAVKAWTAAGMPPEQIILGVPAYGRGFIVPSLESVVTSDGKLNGFANFTSIPLGDRMDGTNETAPHTGVFNFWGLIEEGFLYANGTANEGIQFFYDDCSQTPFVCNETSKAMVSFDDARSFGEKGKYIAEKGLAGFSLWYSGGDSQDILLNGIKQGMESRIPT